MKRVDVLVLDDEVHILTAVRRSLGAELAVDIETTTDPVHALQRLAEGDCKVLITDFRMPVMNGVEVLREARRIAPDTIRILLTGHAEKQHVIEAINSGKIFRFIAKPWENEALARIVREALDAYEARHDADRERQSLERAVGYVSDLQRAVLGSERLELPGAVAAASLTPCEHASGDYVDTMVLPCGRTALIVGDVSGHGLGAALFVFTARALLRSGLSEGQTLREALLRTNRFLCRDMNAGRFITLFVGLHDAAGETLTYINGGHSPPMLVADGRIAELTRTSLPLGVDESCDYAAFAEVALRAGDLLFGYTDGLVEARNSGREFFGFERLKRLLLAHGELAPHEILALVRNEHRAFVGSDVRQDDLSLLVYRPARNQALVCP